MSTNINELPSVAALQELANQFFKTLPENAPREISLDPYAHPRATGLAKSFSGEGVVPVANSTPDEITTQAGAPPAAVSPVPVGGSAVPFSATGLGPSASAYHHAFPGDGYTNYYLAFNDTALQPIAPATSGGTTAGSQAAQNGAPATTQHAAPATTQYTAPQGGGVPASVAGSGASPSYVHQQENFSIKEPVTSFPDSNIDKPAATTTDPSSLPFLTEQPYWSDMAAILEAIGSNRPAEQPGLPAALPSAIPSFYFVPDEKMPIPAGGALGGYSSGFDAYAIKKDFPILNETVNGKPLVWLDNAATTQKPRAVIDRISYFYQHENSNIHRAAHELAARATDAYEAAREKVRTFLGAVSVNEIIFVRGATEGINLVANSWGEQYLRAGDEIIVSHLEHHANIVPWKRLADRKGLVLKVIPVDDDGQILLDAYAKLLTPRTKLVAFTQVSNALGTVTPAEQITAMAHAAGAKVLVDGAQSVSHMPVNVQSLDADWFVFSGHKVFGPTGIGVVYGKEAILNATEPWQGGGNMIQDVSFEEIKYHKAPARFEAGTGNIADAVGLGAAIDYVSGLGMANIGAYEHALLEYATHHLKQVPGVRLIGTAAHKASVLSFVLQGYTNDDVGKALNREGIAVRTGHHCAQPILRRMGVETTVRPSLAFYNTCEDVDRLVAVVRSLKKK